MLEPFEWIVGLVYEEVRRHGLHAEIAPLQIYYNGQVQLGAVREAEHAGPTVVGAGVAHARGGRASAPATSRDCTTKS